MNSFPSYKNKKILILGLGLLGRGLNDAIFFAKEGAKVTVTDLKTGKQLQNSIKELQKYPNIKFVLGKHREQDILKADLIIRNAAVPWQSKYLQLAFNHNIPVDMDESLFAEYCPCPIIGITGTRGKTTTTTLIYEIAKKTGKKAYLAGNIMGTATLPLIKKVKKDDLVVLELSSWQLQGFHWKKISPHIGVFTNIYPDHLNYYKSMAEYFKDKTYIFKYQKEDDYLLLNKDQEKIRQQAAKAKSKVVFFSKKDVPKSWDIKLLGDHNLENIAAAMQVGKILGLKRAEIREVVESFAGVEHRLQFVRELNKVKYYNDTTSTTPVSSQKALRSFAQPVILLAGGAQKGLDLKDFAREAAQKAKHIILLDGTATDYLEDMIRKYSRNNKIAGRYSDFSQAINRAQELAEPGEVVLLSPGCASFGMFVNEYDRGNQFVKLVKKLK